MVEEIRQWNRWEFVCKCTLVALIDARIVHILLEISIDQYIHFGYIIIYHWIYLLPAKSSFWSFQIQTGQLFKLFIWKRVRDTDPPFHHLLSITSPVG